MGEGHASADAPDLRGGIELDRLREDEPFAARIDGEAVVLVRQGDRVSALGGACTHYGGPLAEGLVVGDTIRCPWHHACFSLRTGEALGAPALNPLPRWSTEIRDGVVHLREVGRSGPLDPHGREAEGPSSVVIVGGGAAGSAAAEMLRREGYAGRVIVVDPDEPAPYDRPNLSKDYLAGTAEEDWIPLRPRGFYEEHGIERITSSVVRIDPAGSSVTLADGATLGYGALLLATGAEPVQLPLPGADLPHVHTLRSLADCKAILATAERAPSAVVLGASFIGMEVAASLRTRGLSVAVVAPDAVPFERTLGPELGKRFEQLHRDRGVVFHLGHTAAEISGERVRLDDGTGIPAELVVIGVGVKPRLQLAAAAGLDGDGGVLVDEYLRTRVPNIFAAGDIARWRDPRTGEHQRVEHWVVAQRQGQAAARNILGREQAFLDVPFFWTRQFDVTVAYAGHARRWTRTTLDGDPAAGDCALRYFEGERLLAVATIGRDLESLATEAQLEFMPALAEARSREADG